MHLPLFPLELVVFPGESLNLHIFEERYKQLLNEASESGLKFGIPSYQSDGKMLYGTEIRLDSISKIYEDGKMDVKTKGLRVFKLMSFENTFQDKLYPGGKVLFLDNEPDGSLLNVETIFGLLERIYTIMNIENPLPQASADFSVFEIAHKIGMSFQQELHLISLVHEADRQEFIIDHLKSLIPVVKETEAMKEKIKMNGHFKNIIPPKV